jgi:hypothetical protein
MKKLLLSSIAALFLVTEVRAGDAAATERKWPSPNFVADCRRDRLKIFFDAEDYENDVHIDEKGSNERRPGITIDIDKAARRRLEKELRDWRKCDLYYQCLEDRDAGKVKHCYRKDKRWRDVFSDEL